MAKTKKDDVAVAETEAPKSAEEIQAEYEKSLDIEPRQVNGIGVEWSKKLVGPVTRIEMLEDEVPNPVNDVDVNAPTKEPQGGELHPAVLSAEGGPATPPASESEVAPTTTV